jgi:hypothetical protein
VVCALRNRADLAIDPTAANPKRLSTGDVTVAMSRLRLFATSFVCGREVVRDAEAGFDRRAPCRRDNRVPPPLGAAAVPG